MSLRYLFGPVTKAFADDNLDQQRQSGNCLTFNSSGAAEILLGPHDSWTDLVARLPAGWLPDFVVLYLPYTSIPNCLWTVPVPIVGLAADWNLLWHWYRHCLPACDLVLTDFPGVSALAAEGISHARQAVLFGCGREFHSSHGLNTDETRTADRDLSSVALSSVALDQRDIDILFVGNFHPAVQRERLAWLGRIAQLGYRWRISLRTGAFGAEYRDLLSRARIVFNRSIRGEANRRVFEALAGGAPLFQEAGNREVEGLLREGEGYVAYTEENLEERLHYYLEDEGERRRIAEAGRARIGEFTFARMWEKQLDMIEKEWPGIQARCRQRMEERSADYTDFRRLEEGSRTRDERADPESSP